MMEGRHSILVVNLNEKDQDVKGNVRYFMIGTISLKSGILANHVFNKDILPTSVCWETCL